MMCFKIILFVLNALIVLCSPSPVRSKYVYEENQQFHYTKTVDNVRLGCYGHYQNGKMESTFYVADSRGYRLVPYEKEMMVYPKVFSPRVATFSHGNGFDDDDDSMMAFPERCSDRIGEKPEGIEFATYVPSSTVKQTTTTTLAPTTSTSAPTTAVQATLAPTTVTEATTTTEAPQTTEAIKIEPEVTTTVQTPPKKYRITFLINHDESGVPTKLKTIKIGSHKVDGENSEEAKNNRRKALARLWKLLMTSVNSSKSEEEATNQSTDGKFEDILQKEEVASNCPPEPEKVELINAVEKVESVDAAENQEQDQEQEMITKLLQDEVVPQTTQEAEEIIEATKVPAAVEYEDENVVEDAEEVTTEKYEEPQKTEDVVEPEIVEAVTDLLVDPAEKHDEDEIVPEVEEEAATIDPEPEYATYPPTEISVVTSISTSIDENKSDEIAEPPKEPQQDSATEIPSPVEETTVKQLVDLISDKIYMKFPGIPEEKEDPNCSLLIVPIPLAKFSEMDKEQAMNLYGRELLQKLLDIFQRQ